jgi:hypothetical protein
VRTNSGESILERCERKSGRQGATPTFAGAVAVDDIERAIRERRAVGEEAMLGGCKLTSAEEH